MVRWLDRMGIWLDRRLDRMVRWLDGINIASEYDSVRRICSVG